MRTRALTILLFVSALLSVASTCVVTEEGIPEEPAYEDQSAEEQTMDEQAEEVDEDINR